MSDPILIAGFAISWILFVSGIWVIKDKLNDIYMQSKGMDIFLIRMEESMSALSSSLSRIVQEESRRKKVYS